MRYIYKITFSPDKVYIGQTIDFESRMNQHRKVDSGSADYMKNLINEYGWDNIDKTIICKVKDGFSDLLENYFIDFYRKQGVCVNVLGGLNKKLPRATHKNARQIVQLDLNGSYVKTHSSSVGAASYVKGLQGNIISCCNNNKSSAYGFLWAKKSDYDLGYRPKHRVRGGGGKKEVEQYDLKGNKINSFESITEAIEKTGIEKSVIIRSLKLITKNPRKYVWKYKQ